MWRYVHTDEMYHYGILGQKWGIRRYQNKDGSLTPAGRRRANKLKDEYTKLTGKKMRKNPDKKDDNVTNGKKQSLKKTVSEMSDAELKDKLIRLQNEKQVIQLEKERASIGQKALAKIGNDVVKPSLIDAGKNVATAYLTKMGKEALGLDSDKKNDSFSKLQKDAKRAKLERQLINDLEWLEEHKAAKENGRRALTEDVKFKKKK